MGFSVKDSQLKNKISLYILEIRPLSEAIAKYWKQPKCPSTNKWIKKLWYIYTMEFYAAERKKELRPFATAWMELESIMLSEISQAVRDKYHMISPLTGT